MIEGIKSYKGFLLLVILVMGYSCSVEKNTNMSRFYHNLTSHYNIYFNGIESYLHGMESITKSHRDDYTTIMSLFEYSNPDAISSASSDMDRAIQKAGKLIHLHSITAKPERKNNQPLSEKEKEMFSRNDYNDWVDDSYLLMGKAQIMKHDFSGARITFLHNIRESHDPVIKAESTIWLARAIAEAGDYYESMRLLTEMETGPLSKKLLSEFYLTRADIYMKQRKYNEAIPPLSSALENMTGKSPKNRQTYILARLYEETDRSADAGNYYKEVLKLNPPYELEFNAKINQAGVFDVSTGNSDEISRELNKLLKDAKNKEYHDLIYYALGNLSMREGNIEEAIDYMRKSASASTTNTNQKGKSYLVLADHFFNKYDYRISQVYYDSAVIFLDNKYPGYNEFYERSLNLNELSVNLNVIDREDSLQYVASLPEAKRESLINEIIRQIEEEERARETQTDDRYNMGEFYENQRRFRDNIDASGKWYFYNQAALTFGRSEFRNRWGQRKLEDNWRRSNKSTMNFDTESIDNLQDPSDSTATTLDNKSPEFYRNDLPLTDSLINISNDKIAGALFNASKIFADRIKDPVKANETYNSLIERFPDHDLIPPALYNLHNLNIDINRSLAEIHKNRLITRFPETEYAMILSDPDYFQSMIKKSEREEFIYNSAYTAWENEDYELTISICDSALEQFPEGKLTARFMLLRTYALAKNIDERSLKAELNKIVRLFPDTDESRRAEELIAWLNKKVPELKIEEQKEIARKIYSASSEGQHSFVLIIKNRDLDINRLTFDVINFNIDNFTNENYSTKGELVDDLYLMITVGTFENSETATGYYHMFDPKAILSNTDNSEVIAFIISDDNLKIFITEKDSEKYHLFFLENYLMKK